MIRGSLVSLICFEAVELDTFTTAGSATLTLMSTDVERICSSFENFHALWANPIEIIIAIWLLERQLGVGCIGPVVVVVGMFFFRCCQPSPVVDTPTDPYLASVGLMSQLSKYMGPAQKIWNQGIQKRVAVVSSVVGSIKEVKMQGMAPSYVEAIQDLRVAELRLSKGFRRLIVYANILGKRLRISKLVSPLT